MFQTKFFDLKRIISDLGVMKITLKPNEKLVKQHPYQLNPKFKEKVHEQLDKMIATGIIEPVEESNWVISMMVQERKKNREI